MKFDSRAGWFKEGDMWVYRTADTWPMLEIPSIVREKTLGIDTHVSIAQIAEVAKWLKGIRRESLRLLVLSILYVGLSCSRILRMMKLVQGKYIVFSYESERIRFFLEKFFCFFMEDSVCKISLSMPTKDLIRILQSCKDQIVVIDVDAEDISGRRKQNIALLRQYICGGNLPEGESAESLVVFITNGIPKGISFDDAMVFSVHNKDFDEDFLEVGDIRCRAAELMRFFVEGVKKDERRFRESFTKTKISASLGEILWIGGNMAMGLLKEFHTFDNPENIRKKFASELKAAEKFSDVVGIGGIVSEALISKVRRGEVRLRKVNQRVEREELNDVILYDKKAFYLSDALIKKVIISEFASVDITVIILRKYLATEGFLLQYESESGEKSYKKKRILKAKDGGHYSVWMTAILQKKVDEVVDIEIEELLEGIDVE